LQKYNQAMLAKQKYLGVKEPRLLSRSEATRQAGILASFSSSEDINRALVSIQSTHGDFAPKAFAEIKGADKSLADYGAVFYADPATRGPLIDSIKNADAIKAEFSGPNITSTNKVKKEGIDAATKSVMSTFRTAT